MSYTRPPAGDTDFAFEGAYSRPPAGAVAFSFAPAGSSGIGAATLGPLVGAGVAAHGAAAAAAVVLAALLSVGVGEHENNIAEASGAVTLAPITTSAQAAHGVVANASAVIGQLEAAGDGAHGVAADGAATLDNLVADGAAFRGVSASASPTMGAVVAAGSGSAFPPDYQARLEASGPLFAARAAPAIFQDFTAVLGDGVTGYVMDVLDADEVATRIPISSWQATLRSGAGSNYAQCVVPGVQGYVAALQAGVEFVIYRTAKKPDGGVLEYEMVRCPLEQLTLDRGASRHTATLAGYFDAFAADEPGTSAMDRALKDVRSVSISEGGTRIRCAVDWLLRPGRTASYDGLSIPVTFINYYVNGSDQYMDAGSFAG